MEELEYPRADWLKHRVVLVHPGTWNLYRRRANDLQPVFHDLIAALNAIGANVDILTRDDAPLDIWIRDWGLVEGSFFRYRPSYAKGCYSDAAIRRARAGLINRLHFDSRRAIPVVLDGGNVVHNGRIAIVTHKVLRDNPALSRREIERAVVSIGFERVVFIPEEPGDVLGHADGVCRFVSSQLLLLNEYNTDVGRDFGRQLRHAIWRAKLNVNFALLPWFHTDSFAQGVPSAEGCYMNFVQVHGGIVAPAFDHSADDKAQRVLVEAIGSKVTSVKATSLASFGGVFNCVSLTL